MDESIESEEPFEENPEFNSNGKSENYFSRPVITEGLNNNGNNESNMIELLSDALRDTLLK